MVTGLVLTAMEHYDRQSEELARVYAPDHKVLLQIVLPSVWPFTCAAGILVFVLSVTDFSVPSLFSIKLIHWSCFPNTAEGATWDRSGGWRFL